MVGLVFGVCSIGELDVVVLDGMKLLFYCGWGDGGHLVGYLVGYLESYLVYLWGCCLLCLLDFLLLFGEFSS